MIKKEQGYASTPFLCFHGLFKVELSPFTFSLEMYEDTDNCEYRRSPTVSCTLCEQTRTRKTLGYVIVCFGRVQGSWFGVRSPQTPQASFCTQSRAVREPPLSWHRPRANVFQLSLFCSIRSCATSICSQRNCFEGNQQRHQPYK